MNNNVKVPSPLGFCVRHIAVGHRIPATAIAKGDGVCDGCAIDERVEDPAERPMIWNRLRAWDDTQAALTRDNG